MKNCFTLSCATKSVSLHMKIINSYVEVEGKQNCKLLQKPKRSGVSESRRKKAKSFQFVAGGGFVLWICNAGEKYENMYRNKLSSRCCRCKENLKIYCRSRMKNFQTLAEKKYIAFDSSKFIHSNLIHWLVDLTNREKPNLGKSVFAIFYEWWWKHS